MEDGKTRIEIISVDAETEWSILIHLRKQKLPNGKKIPSGATIFFPRKKVWKIDTLLKYMVVDNDFLNKLRFDE